MTKTLSNFEKCRLIETDKYDDIRGYFMVQLKLSELQNHINLSQLQANISYNRKIFTFRGMHSQKEPYTQNKIVFCLFGRIIDVVVDLREHSPTYLKEEYFILDSDSNVGLFVPKGYAHGFLTLVENTLVQYFTDNTYSPENETSINFQSLSISKYISSNKLVMSKKDSDAKVIRGIYYD
jgi:dTDP-4-dehydrorhamnose 3,5-epimerase